MGVDSIEDLGDIEIAREGRKSCVKNIPLRTTANTTLIFLCPPPLTVATVMTAVDRECIPKT
ncbi:hypothetical protein [Rathayibacter toxicus]|uniref:hypothetical protein n=1 Tax=Rathayibacter toxicus TaxID=145458 RepID=UPI001C04CD58|nr:hypothetical protein [Rathayibacter toxicus]QWL32870.1 hypothetical protein E2R35_08600 [Rathayibacter toxicus]QWL34965.1 hypothetical protein E2R36_08605 [Rathayibacter toxicus]QWL37096.1 hypothetical protein E2R37_08600 [Rathayibacter toxicus]QWL39188.1 hypothetical protein E2R38_08595 [Rathayibacter toxicus]QWL41274.1 hypothetical protein E2R39_08600 [Rathayibacter toxicus]